MHIPHTRLQEEQYEAPVPVIADRAHQARCRNALEPEWEARFEPKSYGFRPGRSCQDAIAVIHVTSCGKTARRVWVLDADLSAAFDRIDHNHLLATIGTFPGRDMIRKWLKAGVFEPGKGFAPTDEGTPQGDVISPLLLNIALHRLEEAAGVRHERSDTRRTKRGSPSLVRYADDMVALCHTRQEAEQVKARLAAWLAPRGLTFNEDKTRIVHLDDGFDFLGFTIRRMRGKLIIKPSKAAIKRVKHRLTTECRALRAGNVAMLLVKVNPIIRGWANYYHGVAASRTFAALDRHLWQLAYKWACYRHYNKASQDRWVLGDRDSGAYMPKFAWTAIVRHSLVRGQASPDDPAQAEYWATRRRKRKPLLDPSTLRLLHRQHGRCPICQELLLHADREPHSPQEWEQWHRVRPAGCWKASATRRTSVRGGRWRALATTSCSPGPGHRPTRRHRSRWSGPARPGWPPDTATPLRPAGAPPPVWDRPRVLAGAARATPRGRARRPPSSRARSAGPWRRLRRRTPRRAAGWRRRPAAGAGRSHPRAGAAAGARWRQPRSGCRGRRGAAHPGLPRRDPARRSGRRRRTRSRAPGGRPRRPPPGSCPPVRPCRAAPPPRPGRRGRRTPEAR